MAVTEWLRRDLTSVPPELRDEVLMAKAHQLHNMACSIQDMLNTLPVYIGDDPLIAAKRKIDEACTKARNVADRIRHRRR